VATAQAVDESCDVGGAKHGFYHSTCGRGLQGKSSRALRGIAALPQNL
jgi:hypothetical protein